MSWMGEWMRWGKASHLDCEAETAAGIGRPEAPASAIPAKWGGERRLLTGCPPVPGDGPRS